MLKIDRMTDYAAVVLAELRRVGGPETAAGLADRTGLPNPTVARVLKLLVHAGFAKSARGRSGGYSAATGDVSLLELLEAIEGKVTISDCITAEGTCCAAMGRCPSSGSWTAVNESLRRVLASYPVDCISGKDKPCSC